MSFQSSGNSAVCRVCRRDKNGSAPFVSLFLEDDHHQDDTGSSRGGAKATLASMLEFVGSVSVSGNWPFVPGNAARFYSAGFARGSRHAAGDLRPLRESTKGSLQLPQVVPGIGRIAQEEEQAWTHCRRR